MPTSNSPAPVALVTGSARRIGAAIVRELHAQGWRVAIHCQHSRSEAEALATDLNAVRTDSAAVFAADLRAPDAAAPLMQAVRERFGRCTALVNNASSYAFTPFGSISAEDIDELVATNLKAPLLLTQAAVTAGVTRVVNLLDVHSRHQPRRGFSAYTAAKDGLWAMTEALAVELAPRVRVNGVALGHIAAEVHAMPTEAEELDLADKASQLARIPLARHGIPEDVATAVAYLLSDAAAYMSGAVLPVDGARRLA